MPDCPPGEEFVLEKGGVYMDLMEGAAESIRLTDEEMRAHPRWWGLPEGHVPMRGLLGVRLPDRQGRTKGMILVTDKEQDDFTAEDETRLQQLATLASLAAQHVEARISLEEADRRKDEFLAMLSHELRNPLAPIRNSIHILARAALGSEQARRAHAVIDRQVGHLTRLVDDLLDVTRIVRGKVQLRREPLDFAEIVRRAVDDHRSSIVHTGLELEVRIPVGPIWMSVDRTRIAQVVGNLLNNAAKFTTPPGKVTVTVAVDEALRQATASVCDTGAGISPDMLPRVFEPFTQAEMAADRRLGGLGLGLALVKGLVEMHGGTVDVVSEGPGQGAEFTLRLPLGTGPAEVPEAGPSSRPAGPPRRVLVIEDGLDAAESLREVLELEGHTVGVAYSGPEGIEKARAFRPDIVFCDIGLPGVDGYAVARTLRADPLLPGTRLVALSGYAAPEDVARASEAGFHDHLAKPPDIDQLHRLLGGLPEPGPTP
jgi:two-component system CheB/CheR fusion protein